MVATFPAGGPTDGVARVLAHELAERLRQKVVVENRGGAGGTIGAAAVAKSAPDGHTLLITSTGPLGYSRALYKSLGYDPVKDFTPVAMIGTIPQLIIALAEAQGRDAQGVHRPRAREPGQGQYRRLRRRHHLHILAAQLAAMAGITIQHVHYRGAAGSLVDVIGGQIDAALAGFVPSLRHHEGLGVTWSERIRRCPMCRRSARAASTSCRGCR